MQQHCKCNNIANIVIYFCKCNIVAYIYSYEKHKMTKSTKILLQAFEKVNRAVSADKFVKQVT